ncbi:MAG: YbhB/YbcL family Raf kinase inhibitor-like protein [bacterium]
MTQRQIYFIIAILTAITLLIGIFVFLNEKSSKRSTEQLTIPNEKIIMQNMKIENVIFKNNDYIPTKFTCDGLNINPSLKISEVPAETKSMALVMDDPDAQAGTWVHWVMWNIDPATVEISENSVPAGAVQGTTDFGNTKYGGPCPPSGTHRYFFRLYALDTKLTLPPSTMKQDLENAMQGHVIGQAEMLGLYGR